MKTTITPTQARVIERTTAKIERLGYSKPEAKQLAVAELETTVALKGVRAWR